MPESRNSSEEEAVNRLIEALPPNIRNEVNEMMLTISEEFDHDVKKHIQNSSQCLKLIEKLHEILRKAEDQLKNKFWIFPQDGQSLLRRSFNISLAAHSQYAGTCYAYSTATVVRAALLRLQGFSTPSHEKLREEIITKFGVDGGHPIQVLEFLQKERNYPIRWDVKDSVQTQNILKGVKNQRPYIGAFYFCDDNWSVFSQLMINHPSKVIEKSDFKCQAPLCTDPGHYQPGNQQCQPGGHAVVFERFKFHNSKKVWRIKNSWGEDRGEKGYFFVEPDAIEFMSLIDVYYYKEDLDKPEYSKYKQKPNQVKISGETYEYYRTDWIGKSVFGKVYEAQRSGTKYAIKIIDKQDILACESAKREIKAHESFKQDGHENIVRFIASEEVGDKLYIVMRYYGPESLYQKVEEGLVFPIHTGLKSLKDLAQGLAYIHSKSGIHGDLHAGNILVDNGVCSLTDFGKTTFSEDRDQERIETFTALPPNFSILKKTFSFFSIFFCFLGLFLWLQWQSKQDEESYVLEFSLLFAYFGLLLIFDKELAKKYSNHEKKKRESQILLEKRLYAYRDDIFSLGKVAVAMILGERFQSLKTSEIAKSFDEDLTIAPLRKLCIRMLDDNPQRRPTAQNIVDEVSQLISEENQIYKTYILLQVPTEMLSEDDNNAMKLISIASSCLYDRIVKESTLV